MSNMQVRRVDPMWRHPKAAAGCYIPLWEHKYYRAHLSDWLTARDKWNSGFIKDHTNGNWIPAVANHLVSAEMLKGPYEEYAGPPPEESSYMPEVSDMNFVYQFYVCPENPQIGFPIYQTCTSIEDLANLAVRMKMHVFGRIIPTYQEWINILTKDILMI